tara:strand:- start:795 stop:1025 length:231 start_codon:yes stop_codon:yes gene_type:complete
MIRLLVVLAIIIVILFILKSRSNKNIGRSNLYKKLIFFVVVAGLLFFLATSGKFLIPQILKIIKIGMPFLTKFIGI